MASFDAASPAFPAVPTGLDVALAFGGAIGRVRPLAPCCREAASEN